MSIWNTGDAVVARGSDANRSCGITTGTAGSVTCVLSDRVSFSAESRGRGGARVEAAYDLDTFGQSLSLVPHPYLGSDPGSAVAGVTATRYPDDLGKR